MEASGDHRMPEANREKTIGEPHPATTSGRSVSSDTPLMDEIPF